MSKCQSRYQCLEFSRIFKLRFNPFCFIILELIENHHKSQYSPKIQPFTATKADEMGQK